jgi:hypothetical protein
MFLQELNVHRHDNIIRLLNVLKADNDKDIYLVFEHMGEFVRECFGFYQLPLAEITLHAAIGANVLEEVHKKYILYQAIRVRLLDVGSASSLSSSFLFVALTGASLHALWRFVAPRYESMRGLRFRVRD